MLNLPLSTTDTPAVSPLSAPCVIHIDWNLYNRCICPRSIEGFSGPSKIEILGGLNIYNHAVLPCSSIPANFFLCGYLRSLGCLKLRTAANSELTINDKITGYQATCSSALKTNQIIWSLARLSEIGTPLQLSSPKFQGLLVLRHRYTDLHVL